MSLRASIEEDHDTVVRAQHLSWLAYVLRSRFEVSDDLADADLALTVSHAGAGLWWMRVIPSGMPTSANLGNTLLARSAALYG